MRRRTVTILILAFLALLGGGVLWGMQLHARDALCVARTGVEPDARLFADADALQNAAAEVRADALGALVRQFDYDTGFFDYSLHPSGEQSDADNDIRQLLGSRILALRSADDPAVGALHEQNLEAIMDVWYRQERGEGYVYVDEKSKLGANAMLLRVLVASPAFAAYQREAAALAQGISALQDTDGSFVPWYREPDYAYDADYLLTFYSGEAILALLEYAARADDRAAYRAAVRAQDFYIGHYVDDIQTNYYPAYVPWHTQSLAHLYARTGDARYAEAIFVLTDTVLELQDTEWFVGRFYNPETPQYGSPHGSSDAVYTEGLAYAYEAARAAGDAERERRYYDALVYGVHNLARLQYEPRWWHIFDDPDAQARLAGGIQTNACSRWVRIDTTAHTIDALDHLLAVFGSS